MEQGAADDQYHHHELRKADEQIVPQIIADEQAGDTQKKASVRQVGAAAEPLGDLGLFLRRQLFSEGVKRGRMRQISFSNLR